MTADRRLALGLIVLTVVAVVVVGFGVSGPFRQAITLTFVLAAPGLALSLPMGPMAVEARFVVAVAGSVAVVTLVSLVLLLAGAWSSGLGLAVLTVPVLALSIRSLRRTPVASAGETTAPTPEATMTVIREDAARRKP